MDALYASLGGLGRLIRSMLPCGTSLRLRSWREIDAFPGTGLYSMMAFRASSVSGMIKCHASIELGRFAFPSPLRSSHLV